VTLDGATYTVDNAGNRNSKADLYAGVTTNYGYDNLSHLTSVLHQSGATTLDGASYVPDNAGNRTSKTDLLAGVTSNYGYDELYELKQVTQGANTTESYTYDSVGNRLTSLGGNYGNNSSNELTASPTATFMYDNNGNTQTKVVGSNTTTYAWDFENRLSSVTLPGSGGKVSFKYDPLGCRIYKSLCLSNISKRLADGGYISFIILADAHFSHDCASISLSRAALELENLALRHQIGVLRRSVRKRSKLTSGDRLLWIWLSRFWRDWRSALAIVKPETVVAWHRAGFRLWTWEVCRGQPGPEFSVGTRKNHGCFQSGSASRSRVRLSRSSALRSISSAQAVGPS